MADCRCSFDSFFDSFFRGVILIVFSKANARRRRKRAERQCRSKRRKCDASIDWADMRRMSVACPPNLSTAIPGTVQWVSKLTKVSSLLRESEKSTMQDRIRKANCAVRNIESWTREINTIRAHVLEYGRTWSMGVRISSRKCLKTKIPRTREQVGVQTGCLSAICLQNLSLKSK